MKLQNNLMLADARDKRRATIPAIGLVALKQSGGVLTATTTDLDSMTFASWRNNAEGDWTALVDDLPKTGLTSIQKQGETLEVVDETLMEQEVRVNPDLAYDDFPEFEDEEPILGKLTMAAKDWAEALTALDKAMAKDNLRRLDNIWVTEYRGETVLVATDGYRLACYNTGQYNAPSDKVSLTKSFIRATKRAFKQAKGDITIEWTDTYTRAEFKVGNVDYKVYSKRVASITADFTLFIGSISNATTTFTAGAKEVRNLLKRFNGARWVELETKGECLVCQTELGKASLQSSVHCVAEQKLGNYQPKNLLSVLPTKEAKLDFCFADFNSGGLVIKNGKLSAIVMGGK